MSPNSHQKYCLLPFASFADPLWKVLFQPVFLCICYSVFNRITACLRGLITAITSEINKIFLPNCTYLLDTIHDMTVRPGNDKNSKMLLPIFSLKHRRNLERKLLNSFIYFFYKKGKSFCSLKSFWSLYKELKSLVRM